LFTKKSDGEVTEAWTAFMNLSLAVLIKVYFRNLIFVTVTLWRRCGGLGRVEGAARTISFSTIWMLNSPWNLLSLV